MKSYGYLSLFLLFAFGNSWGAVNSLEVADDVDSGALYPLSLEVVTGNSEGAEFITVSSAINESIVNSSDVTQEELEESLFSTSYSRGIGATPNSCPEGFDEVLGLCAEICPTGYTAAIGSCWEDCPSGWADMGLFCAKWFMRFRGKDIFGQELIAISVSCEDGLVLEDGLCYEPCSDGFESAGSLCVGDLDNETSYSALDSQVSTQQRSALASASTGGVEIPDELVPELTTTVVFAPVTCTLSSLSGILGFIPDPVDFINDTVTDAIDEAMSDWANPDLGSAWFIPTIANTVLFDLSAEAVCEDDGEIAQAYLTVNPSITVEVQSSFFDTALHDLSGVDLVIMNLSIYELIPFRIYGSVGATMSVPTELYSVIDRSLPALLIDGQQYANKTTLTVDPSMELWLSTEAYLRVSSLFDFLPDLLQLGAEFNLDVLDVEMPYIMEEGLRANAVGYEIYREESLVSDLSAGSGSVDSFLRILGIETNIFGDAGDITWDGYQRFDELIYNESSTNVTL
ncbi:MAG: hypothetical protein PVJ68_02540 [Candidatus Thiodiazotropha sp.]|jgi:hypothetical protein